jgi:hypothetical protein
VEEQEVGESDGKPLLKRRGGIEGGDENRQRRVSLKKLYHARKM